MKREKGNIFILNVGDCGVWERRFFIRYHPKLGSGRKPKKGGPLRGGKTASTPAVEQGKRASNRGKRTGSSSCNHRRAGSVRHELDRAHSRAQ